MASSSVNFYLTRNGIINRALRLLNVVGIDENPTSELYNICADYLNMMIKYWQTSGINMMSRKTAYLFLSPSTTSYSISNTGTHCTQTYYQTAITSDEAAAQTVLSVDSTTNITASDYIGIELDDDTVHWTTVVSKTSTTVTITDALPSQASADNIVITYTTKIDTPLEIFNAFRRDLSNNGDVPLVAMAEMDYQNLYNKSQTGVPANYVYKRTKDEGLFYIWQVPTSFKYAVGISYLKIIDDYDLANDVSEFPSEWTLPLVYNLAYYIAPIFGKFAEKQQIQADALMLYEKVLTFNQENASLIISSTYDATPRGY